MRPTLIAIANLTAKILYDQIVKGIDKTRAARISVARRRTMAASSAAVYRLERESRLPPSVF
jgi:hypothetical protein